MSAELMAVCIGCGCDDRNACVDDDTNAACTWTSVDYPRGIGLCDACTDPALPNLYATQRVTIDIAKEREKQWSQLNYTPDRDDAYVKEELPRAAVAYVMAANSYLQVASNTWPWQQSTFKPQDPRQDLIRAAALLVAELERLDRAEARAKA